MDFSPKQWQVLTWWRRPDLCQCEAVICDGAVRSGKTFAMTLSFFCWAMASFHQRQFALCARSVQSVRRNLLAGVTPQLQQLGFQVEEKVSQNRLILRLAGRENSFYLFGGRDESSAAVIQGMTLAGVLLDEVALMPRSFVEQACARCSVEESRLWFSCNPEGPEHWFYKEWILQKEEKAALYLHFTMEDNPSLSEEIKEKFRRRFHGTFFRRFILGEWVAPEGLVYGFFNSSLVGKIPLGQVESWCISCDYGTVNPASFGLWGKVQGVWYRVQEYYYDSRKEGSQKTDGEYAQALARLAGERVIDWVVVDPSAASFIEVLRREGWRVKKADNDVLSGIRVTAELLKEGRLVICEGCVDTLREMGLYCWAQKGSVDQVVKKFDHAMDDMRYFAVTVASKAPSSGVAVVFVERGAF